MRGVRADRDRQSVSPAGTGGDAAGPLQSDTRDVIRRSVQGPASAFLHTKGTFFKSYKVNLEV